MPIAHRSRDLSAGGVTDDRAFEDGKLAIEHGHVHLLSPTRFLTLIEGCRNAGQKKQTARDVRDRHTRLQWRITQPARHAHHAA